MSSSDSGSECPVCYTRCKREIGMESYYISEDYETCPHGCYAYEFSYGNSCIHFVIRGQHIAFYWHYNEPPGDRLYRTTAVTLVADCARRALLEDLLKLKESREDNKATSRQG